LQVSLESSWATVKSWLITSGLYFFQQFGNAFGGLIAAGLLKLDGVHGIAGWRWLFIV